jgi:mannan endo-1,4-beta-mannosidase
MGDCATCLLGGIGQYLAWGGKQNPQDFFADAALIAAYERQVDAVLNHVNALTGVRTRRTLPFSRGKIATCAASFRS